MEQSTGPAGCSIGKITLIDHKYPIPGRAEMLGGAGAIYSGTDNRNIKVGLFQLGQPVWGRRCSWLQFYLLKYQDGLQFGKDTNFGNWPSWRP